MPFVEYSPYFPFDELNAAHNVAWQFLWPTTLGLTPQQIALLKTKLSQIILAAACTGEREIDRLKEIALRGMAGQAGATQPTMVIRRCVVRTLSAVANLPRRLPVRE